MLGQALHNACLESLLLHLRNLVEFFNNGKKQKDDLRAEDYGFDGRVKIGEEQTKAINKNLTHLTFSRDSDKFPSTWRGRIVSDPVFDTSNAFIDHILASEYVERLGEEQINKLIEIKANMQILMKIRDFVEQAAADSGSSAGYSQTE